MAKASSANVIEIIDSDDELDISHNGGAKSSSANVIEIIDSDDELDKQSGDISVATSFTEEKENNLDNNPNVLQDMLMLGSGNISPGTCFEEGKGKNLDSNQAGDNEENLDVCEDILFTSNTKRKRASDVVMSESESDHDDDDNISNSPTTANLEPDKVTDDIRMPRRCLKTLRKIKSKSWRDKTYQQSIPTYGDDELEEDSSYSEGGNMSDFIVDDSDVSDSEDFSNKSRDESNSDAESISASLQDLQDNNKDSYLQDASDRELSGNISLSTCSAAEKGKNFYDNYAENSEKNSDLSEDLLCVVTSKRKSTCNIVISESENDDDDDDDLPISTLTSNHVKEISVDELVNVVNDKVDDIDADADVDEDMSISQVTRMKKPCRRRLKPLRKCVSKSHGDKVNYQQSIPTNGDAHDGDDESTDDLSQSEEGNLSGFIDDADDIDANVIRMKKPRRRRLKPLRKCVSKSHGDKVNCQQSIPTNDDARDGDDESIDDLSQSEEGNLSGFIDDADVDSDDLNNSQDLQVRSKDSDSQDVSDDGIGLKKLLSKIQRKKKQKIKWESEEEMLAELGNDPVLCMKAVCVLYRQQTGEEQNIKGTLCRNGRGFSTHHAYRGSKLAEFLLDGSPDGGINKTVEELQNLNPTELKFANHLLFITQNNYLRFSRIKRMIFSLDWQRHSFLFRMLEMKSCVLILANISTLEMESCTH